MLTRSCRLSRVLPLLLAAAAPLGHAADPVVYSQPATASNYYTTWDSTQTPSGPVAIGYDNFSLASATSISAVQWNGNYIDTDHPSANPVAPTTSSFTVAFFSDSNGQPGQQLATTTIAQADCAPTLLGTDGFSTSSSIPTYQIPFYSYRAALPTPFTVAAGQKYWVSIVGNVATSEDNWSWFSGSGGDNASIQSYQGTQNRSMDRAFALEGAAPAAATTPTVSAAATVKTADANTGSPGVITLTLSAPAAAKLKVKYTLGGTAVNGTDYRTLNGKAKFQPGQSSVDVQVVPPTPPVGVYYDAFKETVLLTLQPGDGYTVGATKPAKVKIVRSAGIILP